MPLRLRDNLSFCFVGDLAIFLDIEADRYFCLSGRAAAAFRHLTAGQPLERCEIDALQMLDSRGLMISDDGNAASSFPRPAFLPRPDTELSTIGTIRVPIRATARATIATRLMMWRLKRQPLAAILRRLQNHRPRDAGTARLESEAIFALAARGFAHSRLLVASEDRCLARSLAIVSVCYGQGVTPSLAFGVRTHPFTAHCWAQDGTCVLNDTAEHVRLFTPILVL